LKLTDLSGILKSIQLLKHHSIINILFPAIDFPLPACNSFLPIGLFVITLIFEFQWPLILTEKLDDLELEIFCYQEVISL